MGAHKRITKINIKAKNTKKVKKKKKKKIFTSEGARAVSPSSPVAMATLLTVVALLQKTECLSVMTFNACLYPELNGKDKLLINKVKCLGNG